MEDNIKKTIKLSEEDYLDDPITLFKIDTPVDKYWSSTCVKTKLMRPQSNLEEEQEFSVYGLNSSLTLPVRFFNISKNLIALGKCRQLNVKLANCKRIPFCKRILKSKNKKKVKKDKIFPGLSNVRNLILDLFDAKKAKITSKSMHSSTTTSYGGNLEIENIEKTVNKINFRENTGLLGMKITSEPAEENDLNIYNLAVDRTVSDKKIPSNVLDSFIRSKHNSKALKEVKEKVSSLTVPPKPCHSDEVKKILPTNNKTEGSYLKTGGNSNEIQKISSKPKKTRKPRSDKGMKRASSTDSSKDIVQNKLPANPLKDESTNQYITDPNKNSSKSKTISEHLVGKKIKYSSSVSDHNEKITKTNTANKDYSIDNHGCKKNAVNESKLNHNNQKSNNTSKSVHGPKTNKESKSYIIPKTNVEAKTNIETNSCNKTDFYHRDLPESKLVDMRPGKDSSVSTKYTDSNIRSCLTQRQEKVVLRKQPVLMINNDTNDINNGKKALDFSQIDNRMNTCPTPIINHSINYSNNTHKDCNVTQIDDRMNTCSTPIIDNNTNYMTKENSSQQIDDRMRTCLTPIINHNYINNAHKDFNVTQIDDRMSTCPTPIINYSTNYITKGNNEQQMDDRMSTCPTPIIKYNKNYTNKVNNARQMDDRMSTCPTPIIGYNTNYMTKGKNEQQMDDRISTCPTPIINYNTNYMNKGNNAQQMDDRLSTCPTPIIANIANNDIKVQTVDQINKGYNFKTGPELMTPSSTEETSKIAANDAGALLSIYDIKKEKCDIEIKEEVIEKEAQASSHASKINHSNVNLVKPMPNDKVSKGNTIKTVDSQRDRGIYQHNFEVSSQNDMLIPLPQDIPPPLGPFNYPPPTNSNFNQGIMQYTGNSVPYNGIYSNFLGSESYQQNPQLHNSNYPEIASHLPNNVSLNDFNFHPNAGRNLASVPQSLPPNLLNISCNTGQSSKIKSNQPIPINLSQNMSHMPLNNNMPQNMTLPNMASDMPWYQRNVNPHFGIPANFIPPMQQQVHAQSNMMMNRNVTSCIPPPPPPPVTSKNINASKTKTVIRVSTVPKQMTKTLNYNKKKAPLLNTPAPYSTAATFNVKMTKIMDPLIRRYFTAKSQLTSQTPGNNNVPAIHGQISPSNIITVPKEKFIAISKLVDSISKENNNNKVTNVTRSNIRTATSPSTRLADVSQQNAVNPKYSEKISLNDYNNRSPIDDKGIVDLCD